jgi:hypothetical protein
MLRAYCVIGPENGKPRGVDVVLIDRGLALNHETVEVTEKVVEISCEEGGSRLEARDKIQHTIQLIRFIIERPSLRTWQATINELEGMTWQGLETSKVLEGVQPLLVGDTRNLNNLQATSFDLPLQAADFL